MSKRVRKGLVPLAALVVMVAVLLLGFRDRPVTSLESSYPADPATEVRNDIRATVPLFDDGVGHTFELSYEPADFDRAVTKFCAEGEKTWMTATAIIDGTPIDEVGIRLKGNVTLTQVLCLGLPAPATAVPWLVRFDKYVPGQRYDGVASLVIRPQGSIAPVSYVNELAALNLLGAIGEPTQQATHVRYSANGEQSAMRLVVANPDADYAGDLFVGPGVLYKAVSGGSFVYLGEDQDAYAASFEQINRQGQQDLQPLLNFIKFVEQSTDQEFAEQFAQYMNVENLASYLAFHNILTNFDDLSAPGQNYYLYYDFADQQFSIVSWDVSAAMEPEPRHGPFSDAPSDPAVVAQGNLLRGRFLDFPEFRAVYERRYKELFEELLANGAALGEIRRIEQLVLDNYGINVSVETDPLAEHLFARAVFLQGEPFIQE